MTQDDAGAETYALLIGVSGYPSLPAQRQLIGPRNDVLLLRDTLQQAGVPLKNIRLLADGVYGASVPTYNGIMNAFKAIGLNVHRNDWVIVYFSGHGTQQPQRPNASNKEPDGLDEVFLPYDIGRWDGKLGEVKNGLIDDDIGEALQGWVHAGARVWAIFDTCHAGDMAKAIPSVRRETVWRRVPPAELGVTLPQEAKAHVRPRFIKGTEVIPNMVFAYASRSDEPAGEEKMTGSTWHGVFTYHLAKAIASSPTSTVGDWAKQILQGYRDEKRPFPHPFFVGDLQRNPLLKP